MVKIKLIYITRKEYKNQASGFYVAGWFDVVVVCSRMNKRIAPHTAPSLRVTERERERRGGGPVSIDHIEPDPLYLQLAEVKSTQTSQPNLCRSEFVKNCTILVLTRAVVKTVFYCSIVVNTDQ